MAKLAEEQKVELRDIISDLKSLTNEMNRHKSESASKAQAIINDIKRLYNTLVDINEAANKLEGLAEHAVEGFAEVGMQPPREVAIAMDDSGSTKKAVTSGVKTLKNAMNNIQNAVRRL